MLQNALLWQQYIKRKYHIELYFKVTPPPPTTPYHELQDFHKIDFVLKENNPYYLEIKFQYVTLIQLQRD